MSVKITYAGGSRWHSLRLTLPLCLSDARTSGVTDQRATLGCQNLASLWRTLRWCSSFYGHILSHLLHFLLLLAAGGGAESNRYHNSVISNWRKPKLTLSRVYQQAPIIYGFTVYRGSVGGERFPVFYINGSLCLDQFYYNACLRSFVTISFLFTKINLLNENLRQ